MLARPRRLRRKADFITIYRHGQTANAPSLTLRTLPNRRAVNRAAVVVSTKVAKKAVVRNRIRRRVFGLLADRWSKLKPGFDLVIVIHADISRQPKSELALTLDSCLRRLGVLN